MNVSVRELTSIGRGAMLGMGAVVVEDLPAGEVWVGCPGPPTASDDDVVREAAMKVPLVDLAAQQREIADEVRAGSTRSSPRRVRRRAAGRRLRGGVRALRGRRALRRRRQRHRRARARAARGGGHARGRGRAPGQHVHRDGRGRLADRCAAGARRRRPRLPAPRPGRGRRAVTARTQAIVPVHLFGQVAPVEELQSLAAERGIPIVEDAAQAQGALRRAGRPAGWGWSRPRASTPARTSAPPATPAPSPPTTPTWPTGCGCSPPTARRPSTCTT